MLFVFDIDGTIVSHNKKKNHIPDSALHALSLIKEKGHSILLATGRNYSQSLNIMKILNIHDGVFCDGGAVYVDGKQVFSKTINSEAISSFIRDIEDNDLIAIAQDPVYNYVSHHPNKLEEAQIIDTYVKGISDEKYIVYNIPHAKDFNSLSCFNKHTFEVFDDVEYTKWPLGTSLHPANINKAYGIKKYLEFKHFDDNEIHVFGDNINDIEMFKAFYENSNVLGDANHTVKEFAKHHLNNIDDDGLSIRILEILKEV